MPVVICYGTVAVVNYVRLPCMPSAEREVAVTADYYRVDGEAVNVALPLDAGHRAAAVAREHGVSVISADVLDPEDPPVPLSDALLFSSTYLHRRELRIADEQTRPEIPLLIEGHPIYGRPDLFVLPTPVRLHANPGYTGRGVTICVAHGDAGPAGRRTQLQVPGRRRTLARRSRK